MTEKDNYLLTLRGEQPEWVPYYRKACAWFVPAAFENKVIEGSGDQTKKITDAAGKVHNDRERYINMLGVEYTVTVDGATPSPGKYLITDITKWREQVTYPFPNLDTYDYKAQAEEFYSQVDHNEKAVAFVVENVFFALINSMGVSEALCALLEEPEAVHDFFKELTDFEIRRLRLAYPYIKPDVYLMADDVATVRELFISPEVYSEMIAPYHRQIVTAARELGMIVEIHCCGKCEKLIPQWVDMGISVWQPAQRVNNLKAIKEKYGPAFIFNGCWDASGKGGLFGASEDVVRESVREAIDEFAPGGGYVFWDGDVTGGDYQKFAWTADEADRYGRSFYKA